MSVLDKELHVLADMNLNYDGSIVLNVKLKII